MLHLTFHDTLDHVLITFTVERKLTHQHKVEYYSYTPEVWFLRYVVLEYLRCTVMRCKCTGWLFEHKSIGLYASDFIVDELNIQFAFLGEENVSCSDVSVSKSLLMKILHSKKYLPYHICGSLLWVARAASEQVIDRIPKITSRLAVTWQVVRVLILKQLSIVEDVGMVQRV